jgi:hypothetical protein
MGKEDRQHGGTWSEESATLREPAAPRIPRQAPHQDAREATDALLREILEEGPEGSYEPDLTGSPEHLSPEEDWPSELHPLPFSER